MLHTCTSIFYVRTYTCMFTRMPIFYMYTYSTRIALYIYACPYILRVTYTYIIRTTLLAHGTSMHTKSGGKTTQGNAARKISPINRSAGVAMINRG